MTGPTRLVVVSGVVVRDAAVLVARRTGPPELAGGWEFPGGKVESGETEPAAVVRELAEELAIEVHVRQLLGRVPLVDPYELAAYGCDLVDGTPTLSDSHDAVRWVGVDELDSVDWLPADRDLLAAVAAFATTA